jgi:hypothetical protein
MTPDRTQELYESTPLAQDASPETTPPDPEQAALEEVVEDDRENDED